MGFYVAAVNGRVAEAALENDEHPHTDDEFLRHLDRREPWERWRGGMGAGLMDAVVMQVEEYFSGRLLVFDLPLRFAGTPFQERVWRTLLKIPFGETRTYGDIARAIEKPTAMRAVGSANGSNHVPLIIPCHRVITSDGKLGGFTGGIGLKRALLAHEAAIALRRRLAS